MTSAMTCTLRMELQLFAKTMVDGQTLPDADVRSFYFKHMKKFDVSSRINCFKNTAFISAVNDYLKIIMNKIYNHV